MKIKLRPILNNDKVVIKKESLKLLVDAIYYLKLDAITFSPATKEAIAEAERLIAQ